MFFRYFLSIFCYFLLMSSAKNRPVLLTADTCQKHSAKSCAPWHHTACCCRQKKPLSVTATGTVVGTALFARIQFAVGAELTVRPRRAFTLFVSLHNSVATFDRQYTIAALARAAFSSLQANRTISHCSGTKRVGVVVVVVALGVGSALQET